MPSGNARWLPLLAANGWFWAPLTTSEALSNAKYGYFFREATDIKDVMAFSKLKKSELAAEAEKRLAGTRWLPNLLKPQLLTQGVWPCAAPPTP
jgi:hypothetical protein